MPVNTSPKVKSLMHRFSVENAAKVNAKTVKSLNYLMKNWPDPCVNLNLYPVKEVTLPKVVALTGGRKLSVGDIYSFTMRIISMGNQHRPDFQYSAQTFLKAVKPFLPSGLLINSDWANTKNRKKDPEVLEAMLQFEEWVSDYCTNIEAGLVGLYLATGDRNGAAYIKVLEKRFRANWNTNSTALRFEGRTEVAEGNKSNDEKPKTTAVSFVFETVPSVVPPGDSNATS